ncbi:hypothetical protein EMA8858_02877 [Emticicia aquatica]|uniref:O-antigen ligase-related domain-containing protein n=1 Tax=Emticicia aquatica TaxID=1681835 RepID=A0ABM9ASW0_9BACT|nr:O-antigen ligase family protein [Emticicia aquatica]CAH0996742.1 hypothetical protein EMA8858_02877 [Emticicia aquatica]
MSISSLKVPLFTIGFFSILLSLQYNTDIQIFRVFPIVYFILLTLFNFGKLPTTKEYFFFYILIIILVFGKLRSNNDEYNLSFKLHDSLLFILFIFNLLQTLKFIINNEKKEFTSKLILGILSPFFFLTLLSIILKLLNLSPKGFIEQSVGRVVLLSYFGFDMDRTSFPLTGGINSFASLLGALFTVSFLAFLLVHSKKGLFLIYSIFFFFMILIHDSRGAILFSTISIFVSIFLKIINKIKFSILIPFFSILLPFIFVYILNSEFISNKADFLQRNAQEINTGNGRLLVWGYAVTSIIEFDWNQLLFGFGEFGHYGSGASSSWAPLFSSYERPELTHPHNTILMTVFDYGIIGLITLLILVYRIIRINMKAYRVYQTINLISIGFFIYFFLIGTTESFFGFYYLNCIYPFVYICACTLIINDKLR